MLDICEAHKEKEVDKTADCNEEEAELQRCHAVSDLTACADEEESEHRF